MKGRHNMVQNKFRYNKKCKHYSYSYREKNRYSENVLLTTDPVLEDKKYGRRIIRNNIRIYRHPNPNKQNDGNKYYIVNHRPYFDKDDSFNPKIYKWKWHRNDKRIVKRFKKYKKYKGYFDNYGK